jgi:hypothetical protein
MGEVGLRPQLMAQVVAEVVLVVLVQMADLPLVVMAVMGLRLQFQALR